ncbi:MAG: hypothetical protein JWN52_8075 [Actinomycetia bacterium]|nr:hypothetical protein [Actinomycetes bacterium]
MTDINTVTADLTDGRILEMADAAGMTTTTPVSSLRKMIALYRLSNEIAAKRGIKPLQALAEAEIDLGCTPYGVRPEELGHDGRCDSDLGCKEIATFAVISASSPPCACGDCGGDTPASLAFLCRNHTADEPIAKQGAAEHNASIRDGYAREVWDRLLTRYPQPVPIAQ